MTLKLEVGKKYVTSVGQIVEVLKTGLNDINSVVVIFENEAISRVCPQHLVREYKEPVTRWLWTWPFSCKVTAYLFSEAEVRKTNWKVDWNEDEAPSIKLEWSRTEFPE